MRPVRIGCFRPGAKFSYPILEQDSDRNVVESFDRIHAWIVFIENLSWVKFYKQFGSMRYLFFFPIIKLLTPELL